MSIELPDLTMNDEIRGRQPSSARAATRAPQLAMRISAAPDAERVITTAPHDGSIVGDLPVSTREDVDEAFTVARKAQRAWAATPVRKRARVIARFHDLVLQRKNEILDLIQAENGKTRRDAFLEVADIALTARYYARTAPSLLKTRRRRGAFPVITHTTELRHPKGVVTVISPWNYPFSLAAGDTIPALLAGNAVVQKPDTQTALSALWAVDLMYEAGLPQGLWQIVVGPGRVLGDALMQGSDYMMFTGSTNSGKGIAGDAGEKLIGASLELGGKNAMIVLNDADLDKAAEGAVRACFSSTGQLCISIERLYVHRSVYDEFVKRFLRRVEDMQLGAVFDFSCDMGSLTSRSQLAAVAGHVDDAVAKGATVLAGGRARPDLGPLFFEPTVLAGVTSEMACYREETFGPLVSVYPFDSVDEAVRSANDTTYGLNASVWTRNGKRGRTLAARLHAGTVNVNEAFAAAWGSVDAPMGGMGDSGLGRRHGAEGLLKYTEAQTIAHQRVIGFRPPARMSYPLWAGALTAAFVVMKKAGMK
ncbi:succinic semialdehyde dehydrogenase [Hoyosella subflava]|uniref:Succinate-semialdehyde dehydrogenase n=1 Tax=Hoyosella subflava (strain DSM 45089 / JCM 17490 / NBRC 109087 / DQS3-9A1) TaxID=443218 RepID=F6ES16_HOYSD|nr:succinic semialdehyde dehydrogenase [Hoyosella subflava]AEF40831.1 Succinate-semialdehyde dehydrogenase [Hoyosella subflava DQS3-9A1]